jgi:two-component system chemotaxis response regulator CheB
MVQHDEGFAGTLRHIQLNDLIQMCCLSAASLTIRVKKGERQGTIHIREGEIVHAVVDDICGEDAFYQILGWESGVFETIDATNITETTIAKNYQFLLMEAAHQVDERSVGVSESDDLHGSESDSGLESSVRVLIVEDSAMMRKILSSMLNADDRISLVGVAKNGEEALEMIDELKPDLILLDINMPVMDGSTAMKHIMIKKPCPVLIMSNIGSGSHKNIIDFLNLGAVDFMSKPVNNRDIVIQQQKIVERVLTAASARLNAFRRVKATQICSHEVCSELFPADHIVVISAGAGGHADLVNILAALPSDLSTCVLALESVPPALVPDLAAYYHLHSRLPVSGIINSFQELHNNHCYFGTRGRYMQVAMKEGQPVLNIQKEVPRDFESGNYLDFLLNSLDHVFNSRVMVLLLSGTDFKSLNGLEKIKRSGGTIVVQDPESCMVLGSLEHIIEKGLADSLADVSHIASAVVNFVSGLSVD